jgi:DNA-binding HxlR family transcriptional regulator
MPRASFAEFHCSLARALDVVGDWWTPLVLRDVYLGVDTFDDIVRDLGVSRPLLKARLDGLVVGGVVDRVEYSARPQRFRYRLTDAGRDLVTVLIALTQWGDRWRAPQGPPIHFRHACGATLSTVVTCQACGGEVHADEITPHAGPGGRCGPGTLVVAERLRSAL